VVCTRKDLRYKVISGYSGTQEADHGSVGGGDELKKGRRSIRLRDYDYSRTGAYFITICALNRECVFGDVRAGKVVLSGLGEIAQRCWHKIPDHFLNVEQDEFIVMPNHVHGLIMIVGATHVSPLQPILHTTQQPRRISPGGVKSGSLGAIIGSYKSAVTRQINTIKNTPGAKLWQRNYYEHIIRSEDAMNRIRTYISQNPAKLEFDRENPSMRLLKDESGR
jgi:REP element-mobilizing transposase RayT